MRRNNNYRQGKKTIHEFTVSKLIEFMKLLKYDFVNGTVRSTASKRNIVTARHRPITFSDLVRIV